MSPSVRFFEPAAAEGRGRGGRLTLGPVTVRVGQPLPLRIGVVEPMIDSPNSGFQRVFALWAKHQGPGDVTFSSTEGSPMTGGVEFRTTATFAEPGEYLLRVQAYEGSRPWGAQCCWTNGYVRVTVSAPADASG